MATKSPREALRLINGNRTKAPAHDDTIESAILGTVVVSPDALATVVGRGIAAKHFYRVAHQHIWSAVMSLHADGAAIDLVTVIHALNANGMIVEVGGEAAVQDLFDIVPSTANVGTYCDALLKLHAVRCREASAVEALRFLENGQFDRAAELFRHASKSVEVQRTDNPLVTPISDQYCVWNGCYAVRVFQGSEEVQPKPLSNFTVSIICNEWSDDGAGTAERRIRFTGKMASGALLPEKSIAAKDWTQVGSWLHDLWGHKPVIHCQPHIFLKVVALQHQDTPENQFFTHTGWTNKAGDKPVFLTPHGPRGIAPGAAAAEASRVSVHERLGVYDIPDAVSPEQVTEGYAWVERLLECGDMSITGPLVSALFLAPLASMIKLDFALFFTGGTGSHKSSLVAAAMAVWGSKWTKNTLPTSFTSTGNSTEMMGFQAKDLPLCIDNYVPDPRGTKSEATATLKRIAHAIGDTQGRNRLNADSTMKASKPFRALCMLTGEDLPYAAGSGATSRFYIVPMTRESLKLTDLERVQEAGWAGKMAPVMTHYLSWLSQKMSEPKWADKVIAYQYTMEKEARRIAAGRDHDRLTSQTSWILTGLELARQSHPQKQWLSDVVRRDLKPAISGALTSRRQISQQSSLSYRFLQGMAYLVRAGKIHGVQADTGESPVRFDIARFSGWQPIATAPFFQMIDRDSRCAFYIDGYENFTLCFNGDEMTTAIKENIRMECPIAEGTRGVLQSLFADGLLLRGGDVDHPFTPKVELWNGERIRMWRLDGRKVLDLLGLTDDTVSPAAPNIGA